MKIEPTFGPIEYIARPFIGFDFSINYTFNIKKRHGIKLNFGGGVIPISYKFTIDSATYDQPFTLEFKATEYVCTYRSFGLDYEYRTKPSRNFFVNYSGGIRFTQLWLTAFNPGSAVFVSTSDSTSEQVFTQDIIPIPVYTLYAHLRFAMSINFPMPKYNLLRIGFSTNLTIYSSNIIGGPYQFSNINSGYSGGYTTWRMSYVGIDLAYIFTGVNWALKQKNR